MNVIGKGSYSHVYRSSCGKYAIKVFKDKFSHHSIREIALMTFLDSPYIVQAQKVELKSPGIWQIYMKKYSFDLSSPHWMTWVNRKIDRYLDICAQVSSAVSYLHKNKVIHGDIKPQNVLFDVRKETIGLCDFNVSIMEPKNYNSSVVQTANYRAPEVNLDCALSRYDYKIDVWSLGCLFYELLTGEVLFKFLSEDSTMGVCYFLGISRDGSRKDRLECLRGISLQYLQKCIEIALANPFHEDHWLFYSPQEKDFFFVDIADVIVGCLRLRSSERFHSGKILSKLNAILVSRGSKPRAETPVYRPPASPIEDVDNEVRELSMVIQGELSERERRMIKRLIKVEANLLKEGEKRLLKATRLLELEYYGKIEKKRILGSAEALLTTCACYYLMACVYSKKDHAEKLLKFLVKKKLREKCEEIMEVMDYELILE